MKIESTHSTDSTVHVVTLNGIERNERAIGIDEYTRVGSCVFNVKDGSATRQEHRDVLMFNASLIIADMAEQHVKRSRASISSASGSVKIPNKGIFTVRVDDCYSVDIDGKPRYVGDGNGSFGLIEKMEGK